MKYICSVTEQNMVFENFPIEMHGGMWRGDMKDYLQYSKYIIIMRKPNHMLVYLYSYRPKYDV